MPFAVSGSVRVAYHIGGQGLGLVLVHGTGRSGKTTWGHLQRRFADRWTVITPDLEGSGETTFHDEPLHLDDLVEQVVAAAVDAQVTPFDLVGYSLGAVVSAQLAAARGDHVRSLVLIAGWVASDAPAQLQYGLWCDLFARDRGSLARLLVHSGFSARHLSAMGSKELETVVENVRATLAPGLGRQAELAMQVDLAEALRQIRARTLVIGLLRDQIVPVENTRALHRAIQNALYADLDTGHAVMFERPDELVQTVRDFLGTPARR